MFLFKRKKLRLQILHPEFLLFVGNEFIFQAGVIKYLNS